MALLSSFLRVSLLFTINLTDEIAQTSFRWAGDSTFNAGTAIAELEESDAHDIGLAFYTLMSSGTGLSWADYSRLVGVKIAAIGVDGSYMAEPLVNNYAFGGGTQGNLPPQNTVCATLWSGETLGDANYGRMYLPHTLMTQTSGSPKATVAAATHVATGVADFLEAANATLRAAITQDGLPVIMSPKGTGTTKSVTYVRVGDVTDTQRRRRNNLPETYQASAPDYGA